ncbi:hypothetical protein CFIMG_001183RA [Ceratocystis fimbriata CBS 114723]|uniref:Uncharacterized protein n=1 Tax=Ceratocystis fimbriata CBS 114723 TaxID=1035309 RepID=A0A2C5XDH9_9PEZI|nr:hypothetical protein CFIMG_001183RA [Ceratocystis fimbriata CBS 114723]
MGVYHEKSDIVQCITSSWSCHIHQYSVIWHLDSQQKKPKPTAIIHLCLETNDTQRAVNPSPAITTTIIVRDIKQKDNDRQCHFGLVGMYFCSANTVHGF